MSGYKLHILLAGRLVGLLAQQYMIDLNFDCHMIVVDMALHSSVS